MNFKRALLILPAVLLILAVIGGLSVSRTMPWPEAPLYAAPAEEPGWEAPQDRFSAMKMIAGHYAHFDIVSYEDMTTRAPMRTFIVSYGFTDFFIRNGRLYQKDVFVHAEQILNQKNTTSYFSDKAAQAIAPRVVEVDLYYTNGMWHIYRPATPSLLGIKGDPALPLSRDPQDSNITDPDQDGHPGVTVQLNIGGFLKGDIYITRKEVYEDYLTVYGPDLVQGYVKDSSEQFVLGASLSFLNRSSHNQQHPDPGMNPVILRRVSPEVDTWEELQSIRDSLFPPEPSF